MSERWQPQGWPPLERVSIEALDCGLLDLVLALSFDPRELENTLSRAGLSHDGCGCHERRGPYAHAHRAAHQGGPVARRLEAQLDHMHAAALRRLEEEDDVMGALDACERDLWACPDLAGLAWAVARCARPEVEQLRGSFARVVSLDGARALAARVRAAADADAIDIQGLLRDPV